MTATPIPRSLALTLFGDLDISLLRGTLPHRKPVHTHFVKPHQRNEAYSFARRSIAKKQQVFVVAPLIDPTDTLGISSATQLYEEISVLLPTARKGLLHGRMSSNEKESALRQFADHEVDILVATAVVEVGIDVPNATVMLIEGAERFGLAQLHQLRGRVGRGAEQSDCFLIANTLTPLVEQRLRIVAQTNDGFALSQTDMKLRGPGDLIGTAQSGFLNFRFAQLGNLTLIERVQKSAERLLHDDPNLSTLPEFRPSLQLPGISHRE